MTSLISIPEHWGNFVSVSFNRVYLNPASGCRGRCKYCYIYEYGHPAKSRLFEEPASNVADWLGATSAIVKGRKGFLVSIGSSCDPFEPNVIERTIELIKAVAPLGNPIQISTKFALSEDQIDRLPPLLTYPGQLVVFATITTFTRWERFEPGTVSPTHRLTFLEQLSSRNIPTCVAIKPFFSTVAGTELPRYAAEIRRHKIASVLVGSFYANERIINKVREEPAVQEPLVAAKNSFSSRPPPSKTNERRRDIVDIDTSRGMAEAINFFKNQGINAFSSAPCVSAFFTRTLCATGVWRYLPHLCVRCEAKCDEMFEGRSNAPSLTFPEEVEGLKAHPTIR